MKILSVDDNAENLYMIEALLRGHGHEVDSASNGEEALRLAERRGYDLIISDILMPRMDGFQLCREIRKDARLRDVPFVFYTATYTDPKDASFALSLGADRFLIKPLEPEQFIKAVEEVIAEHRARPAAINIEPPEDEAIYLKEYNARLIAKLEKKMLDLEAANRALQEDIAERERAAGERAKLEQQLRQSQKMEAIGTLAGGIAHDFNNILGGVIGFAELGLIECADPGLSEQHFHEILKAGERARDLTRQILAFSRQAGQRRLPLDLSLGVNEALKLLRATLPASIEIRTQVDAPVPCVLADATQVHQVVTNLVTNSWHAIGDRAGLIGVTLSPFTVDEDFARTHPDLRPCPYVRLSISDDGRGMSKATTERIFEPFFTTKDPGKGTGLGLSVVHGIMKANDGAVAVYSEEGSGTTFHLYFPALESATPQSSAPEPPLEKGRGQRILFVDDETVLASLGERFLRRLGYEPSVFTDSKSALAAFREGPFDLVVTDLTMPHQNGVELARHIWDIRPGARVVLTTGYSATMDGAKVRELGFRDLLLKPYNVQALGECVQRALG